MITSPKAIPWDFYNLSNRFNTLKRQIARDALVYKIHQKNIRKPIDFWNQIAYNKDKIKEMKKKGKVKK